MVGFEKALGAVKVIKGQIQYRSQTLLNLARGYFRLYFVEISQVSEKLWLFNDRRADFLASKFWIF